MSSCVKDDSSKVRFILLLFAFYRFMVSSA